MLTIKLSPVRCELDPLEVSWIAPVITVNGIDYDLSELPDGATAINPILGKVSRVGDDYEVKIMLPHGPTAPETTRFPEDIVVTTDGPVTVPVYDIPVEEPVNEEI